MKVQLVLAFCLAGLVPAHGVDQTNVPGVTGREVVDAVLDRIHGSCVFPDFKLFLRRTAIAISNDGQRPIIGAGGGIWQIDEALFNLTQNPSLWDLHANITRAFGIDWSRVGWTDLRKPMYSGLAAAIVVTHMTNSYPVYIGSSQVPRNISRQGDLWYNMYRQYVSGAFEYTDRVSSLITACSKGAIDLVFVLDSSGSIGSENFETMKLFVASVVDTFDIGEFKTRVGLINYESSANLEFRLNTFFTKSEVKNVIYRVPYIGGGTSTNLGIDMMTNMISNPLYGARGNEVPKVAVVLTDGQSDLLMTTKAAKKAHDAGITLFAIGVGEGIDIEELRAIAIDPDCLHLYLLTDFNEFDSFRYQIERRACNAPIVVGNNSASVSGTLKPDESITIKIPVPDSTVDVVTVELKNPCRNGSKGEDIIGYISTKTPRPSEVLNELVIRAKACGKIVTVIQANGTDTIYITFKITYNNTNGSANTTETAGGTEFEIKTSIKPKEIGPCTEENIRLDKLFHPYPGDKSKFYQCDHWGQTFVKSCYGSLVWNQDDQTCIVDRTEVVTSPRPASRPALTKPTQETVRNPCTKAAIKAGRLFFFHPTDPNKYIQCDLWGNYYVKRCPPGFAWSGNTCVPSSGGSGIHPSSGAFENNTNNPCAGKTDKEVFRYALDATKFVECDGFGNGYVIQCPPKTKWSQTDRVCFNPTDPSIPSIRPKRPPTPDNPCTPSAILSNNLYHVYQHDQTRFIQCSTWGRMYILLCPQRFTWSERTTTCIVRLGPVGL